MAITRWFMYDVRCAVYDVYHGMLRGVKGLKDTHFLGAIQNRFKEMRICTAASFVSWSRDVISVKSSMR